MERVAKVLVMMAIVLVVLGSDVEGGRVVKGEKKKENVDQPQNFLGGIGGSGVFPSPGFAGAFCTFPGGCTSTGSGTTFPTIPTIGGSPPHA